MKQSQFKKGIIYACAGSLWWGLLGTIFFKYISSMGALEVTVHRLIWTCLILFITTIIFKKKDIFTKIIYQKKKIFYFIYNKYPNFFKLGNMDLCYFY